MADKQERREKTDDITNNHKDSEQDSQLQSGDMESAQGNEKKEEDKKKKDKDS
ncbi:hypothetical protein [Oceanobacillus picturae]|jgi:hypothetical protein|uniref:hypothetical protein n=1 Tax=Oceanobacillus picturae TaxID=171693 RepID=UPI00131BAAD5|nr:hypothetical protein [Halomonas sp. MG34]